MCCWEKSNAYRLTDVEDRNRENGGRLGGVLIQQCLPVIHHRRKRGRLGAQPAHPQWPGTLPRSFASVFSVFTENEELGRSESKRGVMESCRTA